MTSTEDSDQPSKASEEPASDESPSSVGSPTSLTALVGDLDDCVDKLLDRWRGDPVADRVFYTASALGDFGLIWIMLALLRALRNGPNDRRAAVRAMIATGVESVVVNIGVKSLFGRKRPVREVEHPLPFRTPVTSSFPSGHATAAFCGATLLADGDDLGPLYFAVAVVVASSRVYVRIHHASDVAVGAAVGCLLGQIGKRAFPLPPVAGKSAPRRRRRASSHGRHAN